MPRARGSNKKKKHCQSKNAKKSAVLINEPGQVKVTKRLRQQIATEALKNFIKAQKKTEKGTAKDKKEPKKEKAPKAE